MRRLLTLDLDDGRRATVGHTDRSDGDLSPSTVRSDILRQRRFEVCPGDWTVVSQVHGATVVDADCTRGATRPEADALITRATGRVIAIHTADCVPVAVVSAAGAVAVAHAGWKGLMSGVVDATVDALAGTSQGHRMVAAIGPHIHASAYEFGPGDLSAVAEQFGSRVVSRTAEGQPALDLTALVRGELERLGVEVVSVSPDCTARQADAYWSFRARRESGRIATLGWIEQP